MKKLKITFENQGEPFVVSVVEVSENRFTVNYGDPQSPNKYPDDCNAGELLPTDMLHVLGKLWGRDNIVPCHLKDKYKVWLMDTEKLILNTRV